MDTKDVAQRIGTTPRTLRQFLRSAYSTFVPVGSGARYDFTERELPTISKRFREWTSEAIVGDARERRNSAVHHHYEKRPNKVEATWVLGEVTVLVVDCGADIAKTVPLGVAHPPQRVDFAAEGEHTLGESGDAGVLGLLGHGTSPRCQSASVS